jgi:hypothetical protein
VVKGEPLTPRGRFAPLEPDHPLVGRPCVVCLEAFEAGDGVALLDSGVPSESLTVEADPAHETCVVWMET